MILRQLLHTEPVVAASYVVACGGHGVAMVVDPVGDPATYLTIAAETSTRITYVVDTHVHADHLSAGPPLARATGAEYVLHESARSKPTGNVMSMAWIEWPNSFALLSMCVPGVSAQSDLRYSTRSRFC